MRTGSLAGLAIATVTAALTSTVAAQNSTQPQPSVDFVRDIQPILQTSCYECHGPKKTKAHLRLDSPAGILKGGETGPIVLPGKSEQSLMVRRVLGLDGDDRMPKDGDPLTAAQIGLIRSWIDQGARWPGADAAPAAEQNTKEEPGPLGLPPTVAPLAARRSEYSLGADADRSIRPRPARKRGSVASI